jgi:hypothetical protein
LRSDSSCGEDKYIFDLDSLKRTSLTTNLYRKLEIYYYKTNKNIHGESTIFYACDFKVCNLSNSDIGLKFKNIDQFVIVYATTSRKLEEAISVAVMRINCVRVIQSNIRHNVATDFFCVNILAYVILYMLNYLLVFKMLGL